MFSMTRYCNNNGLLNILLEQKLTNALTCIISVHKGHIAIHKDEFETGLWPNFIFFVFFDVILDYLYGLNPIIRSDTNILNI